MTRISRTSLALLAIAMLATMAIRAPQGAVAAPPDQGVSRPGFRVPLEAVPGVAGTFVDRPAAAASGVVTATFIVNYDSGFTPQAKAAFQAAVDIWATLVTSSVPIVINATWQPAASPNNLGEAGPYTFYANFAGAPLANTWYPIAIVNAIKGSDQDPAHEDIDANFNSSRSDWYFGTDGLTPPGKYDLETVVLHELVHGLGYLSSIDCTTANCPAGSMAGWGLNCGGCGTWPIGFDRFIVNGSNQQLINTALFANPSNALFLQATSNAVYFNGPQAMAGNGGLRAKLYAPSAWASGSSISHLDEATYPAGNPNSLITPFLSSAEAIHSPGPIVLGTLRDIGWPATGGGGGPTCYTLTSAANPAPSGSVVASPSSSGGCALGQYSAGSVVQLTAAANVGYSFTNWSGDATGSSNPVNLTMSTNRSATANFSVVTPTCYTLAASASPTPGGSVVPSPSSSGGCALGQYSAGSVVQLTAAANAGYSFASWSGDATGNSNPVNLTMSTNRSATANFSVVTPTCYALAVSASPAPGGSIVPTPASSGGCALGQYSTGTVVQLTAAANAGYSFTNWSGDATGSANPVNLTMSTNRNATANFSVITLTCYTLSVSASPAAGGSVVASPSSSAGCAPGQYTAGTIVQLTAVANAGYSFASWSGGLSGTVSPSNLVISGNSSVTANFTASGGGSCSGATPLTSGVPASASVAQGQWVYFCLTVPAGATNFAIVMTGTGDVDLYDRAGTLPNAGSWTCRPYINGSNESCNHPSPTAGTWYIGLYGYSGGSVSLTATVTGGGGGGPTCYTLTTSASPAGSGSVSANPTNSSGCPSGQYTAGDSVQLTATANAGYSFSSWSGALSGSVNPSNVILSAATSVTANFSVAGGGGPTCYTLSTSVSPGGAGSVNANPTSSSGCSFGQYILNASVQLTASANAGYSFSSWSGSLPGSANPGNLSITGNSSVTANFSATGGGGPTCSGATPLTSGVPASNISVAFHQWAYFCVTVPGGSANLAIAMTGTGDVDLYDLSGALPNLTTYACRPYINGSNESCNHLSPAAGTWYVGLYGYAGGTVSLTATVTGGGGGGGTCYSLTTSASPGGAGSVSAIPGSSAGCPAGQYTLNSVVQLTASANAGYAFSSWSGDLAGSANPANITISANRNVVANFAGSGGGGGVTCYSLTFSASPAGYGAVSANIPNSPGCAAGKYTAGAVVQLTAFANSGVDFIGWSGGASGSANPVNVTISGNTSVTANFAPSFSDGPPIFG